MSLCVCVCWWMQLEVELSGLCMISALAPGTGWMMMMMLLQQCREGDCSQGEKPYIILKENDSAYKQRMRTA